VGNGSTPFLIFSCRKCTDYYPVFEIPRKGVAGRKGGQEA